MDEEVFAPVRKYANAFSITFAQIVLFAPGWANANPLNHPAAKLLETRTNTGLLCEFMNCTA